MLIARCLHVILRASAPAPSRIQHNSGPCEVQWDVGAHRPCAHAHVTWHLERMCDSLR